MRKRMSFDADTANPEFFALDNRRTGSAKRIKHALSGRCWQTLKIIPHEVRRI